MRKKEPCLQRFALFFFYRTRQSFSPPEGQKIIVTGDRIIPQYISRQTMKNRRRKSKVVYALYKQNIGVVMRAVLWCESQLAVQVMSKSAGGAGDVVSCSWTWQVGVLVVRVKTEI